MEHYKNLDLQDIVYFCEVDLIQKTEQWKDIPEYEGYYMVSDLGRVKTLHRTIKKSNNVLMTVKEKILKQTIQKTKYLKVNLYINSVENQFLSHQLVAMAFLGHKPDGTNKIVVDHINTIRNQNNYKNLQLITNRENSSKDKKGKGSSDYIGVSWLKNRNKYESRIRFKGKLIHLGNFIHAYDAHLAYQKALYNINNGLLPK